MTNGVGLTLSLAHVLSLTHVFCRTGKSHDFIGCTKLKLFKWSWVSQVAMCMSLGNEKFQASLELCLQQQQDGKHEFHLSALIYYMHYIDHIRMYRIMLWSTYHLEICMMSRSLSMLCRLSLVCCLFNRLFHLSSCLLRANFRFFSHTSARFTHLPCGGAIPNTRSWSRVAGTISHTSSQGFLILFAVCCNVGILLVRLNLSWHRGSRSLSIFVLI